jgi:two-component system, LytTR family, sensor kinase
MRDLFKKSTLLTKIEFWVLTTIFAFVLFFFFTDIFEFDDKGFATAPLRKDFDAAGMQYSFYKHYFIPQLIRNIAIYISLLALNFVIIPKLLKRQSFLKYILLLLFVLSAMALIFGITGTYMYAYRYATAGRADVEEWIFLEGLEDAGRVMWVLAIYTAIKRAGMYLLTISGRIAVKYPYVRKEAIVAGVIWLIGLLFLVIGAAEIEFIEGWLVVIPSAIALYLFSFYKLIPRALRYNNYQFFRYLLKCMGILVIAFITLLFLLMAITAHEDSASGISLFNSLFQLFITAPVTWLLYKRILRGNEEVSVLQKELKQSTANIDFLRSQINPHFLFNALNTIYGTAIKENAERTSEGIEKLGDMMRFMLQENMQETISLAREIDYLNNYISLQRLRTDTSPNIQINTSIHDRENGYPIAPMLLIPFVENAFKHGISFREPSHIKITLEIKDNTLYFDVYNSKHARQENDPEKDKSGIGLENVSHRLKLLYPGRHELIIRDTSKEFFVHLTIALKKN